jgi:hypothetical protein
MGECAHRRTLTQRLLAGLLAAAACAGVAAAPAAGEDRSPTSAGPTTSADPGLAREPAAAPPVASGLLIHIDPQTGTILKEAAPGSVPLQLTPGLRDALDTSHQGLVEVQGVRPGSGVKVHLQGRFRNPLVATTDASGKVTIQHLHEPAASGGAK